MYYDEVEFEDLVYDKEMKRYSYPCPCGDKFYITMEQLLDGDDVAKCPSCTLLLKIIYDIPDTD